MTRTNSRGVWLALLVVLGCRSFTDQAAPPAVPSVRVWQGATLADSALWQLLVDLEFQVDSRDFTGSGFITRSGPTPVSHPVAVTGTLREDRWFFDYTVDSAAYGFEGIMWDSVLVSGVIELPGVAGFHRIWLDGYPCEAPVILAPTSWQCN